ncbi:MAG: replication-associated recombination protein A [Candidatus Sericytochromatia bacterium]|nr:replication-associated recombination protein A [Candidatus Tanganyikabacteria bacterium]
MSLFERSRDAEAPLAHRMRPRALAEVVGQDHLLGPRGALTRLVTAGRLPSCILWGPPGCGKTTLAMLLATSIEARFIVLSAVGGGVADVRKAIDEATKARRLGQRTVLFIDEIHRFNKAQQDVLLPHVEQGTVTLIGATTEHPGLEVNPALRSRVAIHRLETLDPEALAALLHRALADPDRGLGQPDDVLDDKVLAAIARWSGGDARAALGALEAAVTAGIREVDELPRFLDQARLAQDKRGDGHYDVISALIKSMRGSDPDAALHWLARLLEGGEDPLFVARRLVIFASEDVGNAEPMALLVAMAALGAVQHVGMPEARINLGQAVTWLASAPKSQAAYAAINAAMADVRADAGGTVPGALRGLAARDAADAYATPHGMPGAFDPVRNFWPVGRKPVRYYRPEGRGQEYRVLQRLTHWNRLRRTAGTVLPEEDLPPLPAS